jgi:hypothetical protein
MLERILYIGFCFVILYSPFKEKLMARKPDKVSKSKSFNRLYNNGREETACNISNLSYWITKTGGNWLPGVVYPRLTTEVVTSDGLVWGGYVHDTIDTQAVSLRVGGQVYLPAGTIQGWIEQAGDGIHPAVRIDPANPRARLYRILRGWENLTPEMPDVIRDAAILNHIDPSEVSTVQAQEVIDQYEQDWSEWPVDLGAPLIDVNGNGSWDQEEGLANADQIIWLVVDDLDTTLTNFLLGSPPIGLEVQITIWAYDQPDASLGQTVFKRFRIINKSGFQIDSMYVAQWSDPDVGFWGDDLVGCDTARNLGFAYSGYATDGNFDNFNLPPPAVGYDFLQGPILYTGNPMDSALFNFKYRSGYINLPMTSFGHYSDGSGIEDSWGLYDGTLQWYNMLKGFIPTTDLANPSPYIVGAGPDRGRPTKFPLSGDPFLQTGDIDAFGDNYAPGDRRMELCSGPFNMAPGDTQEVVVALIGGIIAEPGGNNRNAIAQLKLNDDYAQFLFDHLFKGIPKPPAPAPATEFTALTDKIILNWGSNPNIYNQTEKDDPILGFNFEGYNIYQLPSANATKLQATLVKTFDKVNFITTIRAKRFLPEFGDIVTVPIQHGTDSGIQRYFLIEKDYINNRPLYAGSKYYFAVTAYNYNPDPNVPEPSLETALNVKEVIPQPPVPGLRYSEPPGNILNVIHSSGNGDAKVAPEIIEPEALIDANYVVTFHSDTSWTSDTTYLVQNSWNLLKGTDKLISKNTNFDLSSSDLPIQNGFILRIGDLSFDPVIDFSEYPIHPDINSDNYDIGSYRDFGFETAKAIDSYGQGTNDEYILEKDIRIIFNGEYDEPNLIINGLDTLVVWRVKEGTGSIATFVGARFYDLDEHPMQNDISTARTPEGYFQIRIPFEVWDVDDNQQINVIIYDRSQVLPDSNAVDFYAFNPYGRMYTWIMNKAYDGQLTNPDGVDGQYLTWNQVWWWTDWHLNDEVFFNYNNRVIAGIDEFTFSTEAKTQSTETAKLDVDKIKVFPNPYYAYHSQETNRAERFVTFTHLPDKATIRIFNLAGTQVRKLVKTPGDGIGQFLKWDLNNDSGLPVASGFYIAYVDMPDINKTKAVKFFILQRKIF